MTYIDLALIALVVVALAGWSWFLVRFSLSRLQDSNSLATLEQIDARMERRVRETVQIFLSRMKQQSPKTGPEDQRSGPQVLDDLAEAFRESRRTGTPPHRGSNSAEDSVNSPLPEMPMVD